MSSSNGNIFRFTALFVGNSPMNSPQKGQCSGALVFFYRCLNKRLNKQSSRRWFETSSSSLWCHWNDMGKQISKGANKGHLRAKLTRDTIDDKVNMHSVRYWCWSILFRLSSSMCHKVCTTFCWVLLCRSLIHDVVIKWNHFPRYWPFVRGIHHSPVDSLRKAQWRGVSMFSLICASTNGWANNGNTDDLKRDRARYDVIVMVPGRSM